MAVPKVSIITTTYNRCAYLKTAIQSVLRQTSPEWEQIVVDDGSSDETQDMMTKLADPRIHYLRLKHRGIGGLGYSLNRGLAEARSPMVALLEDDDYWPRHRLSLQVPAMKDVVLSYGKIRYIDSASKAIGSVDLGLSWPRNKDILTNNPTGTVLRRLAYNYFIPGASVMTKKQALEEIGGFVQPEGLNAIDFATTLALSLKGRFRYLTSVLAYVRRHYASVTLVNPLRRNKIDATHAYVRHFLVGEARKGNLRKELWYLTDPSSSSSDMAMALEELAIARRLLLRRQLVESRQRLIPLLHSSYWEVRGAAALGILASGLGMNMEIAVQAYGMAPLT